MLAITRRFALPHASLAAWALVLLLSGCASLSRPGAVPASLLEEAQPLGIPGLRIYPERLVGAAAQPEPPILRPMADRTEGPERVRGEEGSLDLLAISAGGDDGAFGAGLLTGWSQAGTRPRFAVVTGVSAGALTAPFAFLGPRYDPVLREIVLSARPEKLFRHRSVIAGLLGDGFASSAPLEKLLVRYITPQVLEDIAREYRSGRDLLIMTTDLDAATPVIWNMGAIAASDAPDSLTLFRRVILASVAIPTEVSPVLIDVAAAGRHFQELHVDGGVAHQVFLPAPGPCLQRCRAFILMNGRLEMEWSATPRRILKIGWRAVGTMLQAEARHDLEHIQATLEPTGAEMQVAYMDASFKAPHPRAFDGAYMRALFDYGVQLGAAGHAWHAPAQAPPRVPQRASPALATLDVPLRGFAEEGQ